MSQSHRRAHSTAGSAGLPSFESSTSLRDNLESIALAILLVLVVRQMVVEAFKIPTGSMAPTLLGVHKEVRCSNCGYVFHVGYDRLGPDGEVQCPNCHYRWRGAWDYYEGPYGAELIEFRRPAWLWHEGRASHSGHRVVRMDAANRVNRWGSRIFVNRFIYTLRGPRRWEVVVFRYPYTRAECRDCGWEGDLEAGQAERCPLCDSSRLKLTSKNYIKRLVGMPGEKVVLQNGDVYVNGAIARKPPAIQKRMWLHVFDSAFVARREVPGVPFAWDFGPERSRWSRDEEDGALEVDALGCEGLVSAAFARPIKDYYAYNATHDASGRGFGGSGQHDVGDCRLALELTVKECRGGGTAGVELRITEDKRQFAFFVPAGTGGEAALWDGTRLVAKQTVEGLRPGEKVELVLENYDDSVAAKLRGKTILRHRYSGNPLPARRRKEVAFGATAAKVLFHRIRIQRDVYYIDQNEYPESPLVYELDGGSYFVLGDNSPESSDSRAWPAPGVPRENLLGEAFAVFWPIHDIRMLSIGPR